MDLKPELQKLSIQVTERKSHISNEEMTKQALIIPFLQKLGYDVFNPLEVRPEYVADFGQKKGEKVDYAIFKNGVPIIFIEAKSANEDLTRHDAQLSRYFNSTPEVKVAILTNGIEYKFFTDLTQDNLMDSTPFFSFNMESISSVDIETIESFTREKFDADKIVKYAEELIYMNNLNSTLKELFKNPSDDFLRFLIKDFSTTRITTNVLDRFRPIVKKAISNTLLEIISEGLSPKELVQEAAATTEVDTEPVKESGDTVRKSRIVTTDEELQAVEIVLNTLKEHERDVSDVEHKDTTHYYTIYKKGVTNWFIRFSLEGTVKYVISKMPVEKMAKLCPSLSVVEAPKSSGVSRAQIQSVEELRELEAFIVLAYDEASH